jgi:hypothetical protein
LAQGRYTPWQILNIRVIADDEELHVVWIERAERVVHAPLHVFERNSAVPALEVPEDGYCRIRFGEGEPCILEDAPGLRRRADAPPETVSVIVEEVSAVLRRETCCLTRIRHIHPHPTQSRKFTHLVTHDSLRSRDLRPRETLSHNSFTFPNWSRSVGLREGAIKGFFNPAVNIPINTGARTSLLGKPLGSRFGKAQQSRKPLQ